MISKAKRPRSTRSRDNPPPSTGPSEKDVLLGFLDYLRTRSRASSRGSRTRRAHAGRAVRHQSARPDQAPDPRRALHLPRGERDNWRPPCSPPTRRPSTDCRRLPGRVDQANEVIAVTDLDEPRPGGRGAQDFTVDAVGAGAHDRGDRSARRPRRHPARAHRWEDRPLVRAVVYDAVGSPLRVTEIERPVCPRDGVVIDVRATGVCRSDWHAWRGAEPVPLPHVPGHEFAGVVAETGPEVSACTVGDRVTVPFVNGCGRCRWCRSGQAQVCPDQIQPGFTTAGSFAQQVAVGAADFNLVQLPDAIDFVTAAALGCRFATAFHALTDRGRLEAGSGWRSTAAGASGCRR